MKTLLRVTLVGVLFLAVLAAVLVALAWIFGPPDGVSLVIDGERIALGSLHPGGMVGSVVAVLVALMVALVAVPLALLLGLGIPALVAGVLLAVALACVTGLLALLFSPLLLIGLVIWWLCRRTPAKPSTTIAA